MQMWSLLKLQFMVRQKLSLLMHSYINERKKRNSKKMLLIISY